LAASLGLGLTLASAATAGAQLLTTKQHPVHSGQPQNCPTPVYQPGAAPMIMPSPLPTRGAEEIRTAPTPAQPGSTAPGTTEPGTTPPSTTPSQDATQPTTPTAPTTPTPDAAAAPSMDFSGSVASGAAEGSGGGNAGILGRGDQNNRFNLFDSHAAIPQNRVWYGIQYMEGYNSGLRYNNTLGTYFTPEAYAAGLRRQGLGTNIFERDNEILWRFGFEYMLSSKLSIAGQGQYFSHYDLDGPTDGWANPQLMLKYAAYQTCDTTVSAVLGVQPQVHSGILAYKDDATSWYPGMLFFNQYSENVILQGGCQFRLPWGGNQVYTFDYGLSVGYYLYKAPCCDMGCSGGTHDAFLQGIVAQVELFGKHVIGDATVTNPFGTDYIQIEVGDDFFSQTANIGSSPFIYTEPRTVYDVTVGGQLLCRSNSRVGAAVSFPVTGANVRRAEYFFTVSMGF
jgi:hypothetical protein